MNTLVLFMVLSFRTHSTVLPGFFSQSDKKDRPSAQAHFQTGAYLAMNGTKLRLNIDKQPGGRVYIQLNGFNGHNHFFRTLSPSETQIRLSLDLTELDDGNYLLDVSDGYERVVRTVRIAPRQPVLSPRLITIG